MEMVIGASSLVSAIDERSTTDGAENDVGTTEGVPCDYLVTFRKLDSPTCLYFFGSMCHRFASPTTLFFYTSCIGDNGNIFLWGWAKWKVSGRVRSE